MSLTVFSTCLFSYSMANAQSKTKPVPVQKNMVQHNGNVFELCSPPADTIYIENIETGEQEKKISMIDSFPIKMNDIAIAGHKDVQELPLPERSINEYFIDFVNENKDLFNQLHDGSYILYARHFVINEAGAIMYYKFEGIQESRNNIKTNSPEISKQMEQIKLAINNQVNALITSGKIVFAPANKNGKKIMAMANGARIYIKVKDHLANVDI